MAKDIDTKRRMKAWLNHKRLSARQASDLSGVTHAMICYVLLGQRDISIGKLNLLCTKAFKTDLRTFFGPLPGRERAA